MVVAARPEGEGHVVHHSHESPDHCVGFGRWEEVIVCHVVEQDEQTHAKEGHDDQARPSVHILPRHEVEHEGMGEFPDGSRPRRDRVAFDVVVDRIALRHVIVLNARHVLRGNTAVFGQMLRNLGRNRR